MDDADNRAGFWLDPPTLRALEHGALSDPFAVLGPHEVDGRVVVRAFLPGAKSVSAIDARGEVLADFSQPQLAGLFVGALQTRDYRLRIRWPDAQQDVEDPYAFGVLLGDMDLHLLAEGRHRDIAHCLGAQPMEIGGVPGVRFAVWAPNARRVSVVGAFNGWDGRRLPMRARHPTGIWEIFAPRLPAGTVYQYEVVGPQGLLPLKADPVAWQASVPPATTSIVARRNAFEWTDQDWLARRAQQQGPAAPVSIYEVHAGSWRRRWSEGRPAPGWDELSDQLVPYLVEHGFTHVELLPVMAHPFGGSWGYQPLGLFAPHAPWGEPEAFMRFVDRCHRANVGVLLDWVPAHFPTDPHGLAHFDGTALYEHEDPREGFHQDWSTLIYNLGRHEVRGFLVGSALHWLEHYHVDGLRVDAVASMLYRDYSRKPGEWIPNRYGGRENLEAIAFLRELNAVVRERCPGAITIAEESTAWPGVTHAAGDSGLGFDFKWNMGWMHDTLRYLGREPVHRRWHPEDLTFGTVYAWTENFVLPLSHDEVVHGKRSLLGRMPGDRWQQCAGLRAYYGFMWAYPGKKLLFMGGELAQLREWNHDGELDWALLGDPLHRGVQRLVGDLNREYRAQPALHALDGSAEGFRWIVADDRTNSVFAFARLAGDAAPLLCICNFTPVAREGYAVGAPRAGFWREVINTDAGAYGGSNAGNGGGAHTDDLSRHGCDWSLTLTLPPLATLWLRWEHA